MKLSCLMTVYNEESFIEYAIESCLPYVDHLVVVEGAYQETIKLGATPHSTDNTDEIIKKIYKINGEEKIIYKKENGETDKDQRNFGLEEIKRLNPDGWLLIIDGDEVYEASTFKMIRTAMMNMDRSNKYASYFKSKTFVNDPYHMTDQEFPRLFKITPECKFVNDNFMEWPDKGIGWYSPYVIKIPYISYYHYSFCKGREKFEQKRNWWMNRGFGPRFDYGWRYENGKIDDPNHVVHDFAGIHPAIMKEHPLWKK